MAKVQKVSTKEFKQEAVRLAQTSGKEACSCGAPPGMNRGIMGQKDPNVRTELLLDTHLNVAKKMCPGILMHHRMSLLLKEARRGEVRPERREHPCHRRMALLGGSS
jgi:hypothetical protein